MVICEEKSRQHVRLLWNYRERAKVDWTHEPGDYAIRVLGADPRSIVYEIP